MLWTGSYVFRVGTKDMTYGKQLKAYEDGALPLSLFSLFPSSFHLSSLSRSPLLLSSLPTSLPCVLIPHLHPRALTTESDSSVRRRWSAAVIAKRFEELQEDEVPSLS